MTSNEIIQLRDLMQKSKQLNAIVDCFVRHTKDPIIYGCPNLRTALISIQKEFDSREKAESLINTAEALNKLKETPQKQSAENNKEATIEIKIFVNGELTNASSI